MIRTAISVINSKGGVGKTSVTANVAGLAAAAGWKVLCVDLDPQGNLSRDLGFQDHPEADDGASLFTAMSVPGKHQLKPIRGVREGLDVIPGGSHVGAAAELAKVWESQGRRSDLVFYETLRPVASEYNLILVDCPPGIRFLQNSALSASRFAVIPTKSDDASLDGLGSIAERFDQVRQTNPHLALLGVILFGFNPSAKRVIAETRAEVADGFGNEDAAFRTIIRHAEAPARDARRRGLLVHEYSDEAAQAPKFWEMLRNASSTKNAGKHRAEPYSNSDNLAQDYAQLTREMLERMTKALQASDSMAVSA